MVNVTISVMSEVLSATQNNYPGQNAVAVATSDGADSGTFRSLYVGASGDITIVTLTGTAVLFKNVPVGFFPVSGRGVRTTGTAAGTAAALVAIT